MKRLKSVETKEYNLEVIECDCGFHLGLDVSYLTQISDVQVECPSCSTLIDTAVLLPEYF